MIEVRDLRKRYGTNAVIDGLSFSLGSGSALALLGANGAGKSTVLKCLLGLVRFEGEVTVGGLDARRDWKALRGRTGYLPQMPAFHSDLTVQETAAFYARLRREDPDRAQAALELTGMAVHGEKPVGALSGGMQQRLALAITLLSDPPLLLLDEPFASLDVEGQAMLQELLAEFVRDGKTVVAAVHSLAEVGGTFDRALVLDAGRSVYEGTLPGLMERVAGRARLVLTLADPAEAGLAAAVLIDAQVDVTQPDGDTLVVRAPEHRHYQAVAALVRAGVNLRGFRTELPALADALREVRQEEVACP